MRIQLGLLHLQLSELTSGSGPPDGAVLAHHAENELLLERYTICERQATSAVRKTAYSALLSNLVYMNPASLLCSLGDCFLVSLTLYYSRGNTARKHKYATVKQETVN